MIGHVVLDTDVASFILKHDSRAELYRPHIAGKLWAVSFQSVAELEHWAVVRGWGARRTARLENFLDGLVILNPDRDLCKLWGRVMAQGRQKGRPIDVADSWVAPTALRYGLPLATHNVAHFQSVDGLNLITLP